MIWTYPYILKVKILRKIVIFLYLKNNDHNYSNNTPWISTVCSYSIKKKNLLHFHKPLISSSSGGAEVNLLTRNHTVPCSNIL